MQKYRYAIGIGINLFDAQAILLREDGKVIVRVEKKRKSNNVNETIKVLLSLFTDILKQSGKYKDGIVGAGLALGGTIDKKKGLVYWPQEQNNSHILYVAAPFKKYLEDKFKLPIFIENDANACAWAEYKLNYSDYNNLIYMFSGVGCGLILNGNLYRGRDGGAGELFVTPRKVMSCSLGNFGFLSQWPRDLGIIKRAKELISQGKAVPLVKRINSVGELSLEDIFKELRNRDKLSRELLKEPAFSLGVKISSLVNLLNPEVVIIGGGLEEGGEFFLDEAAKAVKKYSFSVLRKSLKIKFSSLGRNAVSLGAAHLIIGQKNG